MISITYGTESLHIKHFCLRGVFPKWEESPESQAGVHFMFPTRVGNSGKFPTSAA